MELVEAALAGDRRALARLITRVENNAHDARAVLTQLYPRTGQAYVIGVTGAPGTGKSTLVSQMAKAFRSASCRVGVVAVDPSSPFSGGAILGDRIRMRTLSGDSGVFIRSMATRGSLGGLARSTANVVKVLDACGYQRVLIETVGAGQSEVDIASTAHTALVIQVPGMGDDIQTLKAGILEIADILVVNKADLDGADRTVATLRAMLALNQNYQVTDGSFAWCPPIVQTVATATEMGRQGEGITELVGAVEQHVTYLHQSGEIRQLERARVSSELQAILQEDLLAKSLARIGREELEEMIDRVVARQVDPYAAIQELLRGF